MSISGFPGLEVTLAASTALRARMADLTRQVASGQKADGYAGLGADALQSINLSGERSRSEVYATAAQRGGAFADAAQTTLKGISDAVSGLLAHAGRLSNNGLPGSDAQAVGMAAQEARSVLDEVVSLLGERYAGQAIFGGGDPDGTPIVGAKDFQSTGLFTGIRDQVRGLAAGGGQAALDATKALAGSNDPAVSPFTGFAAQAAQGLATDSRRAVQVGDGISVEVGLYAYRNAQASSQGETTGSWARDLLRGLSIIANLGPDQAALGSDYQTLAQGALASVKAGMDGLTQEQAGLSGQQARLTSAVTRNNDVAMQLDVQIGHLQEVDMARAITSLQSTQSQLEASYRALALLGNLSLANFLS
jgi:flagellin-like hook-associated protein FlgL